MLVDKIVVKNESRLFIVTSQNLEEVILKSDYCAISLINL